MSLQSQLESLLFISSQPLSIRQLSRATGAKTPAVQEALASLQAKYRSDKASGVIIVSAGDSYQLATNPRNAALVAEFLKSELSGELTEPSLETLTIIAYRGPVTRAELEQIRGINCALILRNLLMRGLIIKEEKGKDMVYYQASHDFVHFLGLESVKDLPDYEKLNQHETLREILA